MKKFFLNLTANLIAASLIASIFSVYWPQRDNKAINQQRSNLQGIWLINTISKSSELDNYKNLELTYLTAITVDNHLNINGNAFKISEKNHNGQINFKREYWAKSTISGSLIGNDLVTIWISRDYQGREGMHLLRGKLINGKIIKGDFYSEIGNQNGKICGKRLDNQQLQILPIIKICE